MKMPKSDSLDFSDTFSYINYFHPSYILISMIFTSFSNFLDLLKSEKALLRQADVIPASAGQPAGPGQTLTSGAHCSVTQGLTPR